ncbi:MAG: DUF3604 domain-containing protein [Alphaproteobacteria bacterium]|nr:DUF3604 domain-containing protein [Alphaproteobacteria bacterium]
MSGRDGARATTERAASREAYFGDLHIHTQYSFDSFIYNVRTTPDDAYRYAKGEAIDLAGGSKIRISGAPLDFIAVTDHAEFLGVMPGANDPADPLSKTPVAESLRTGTQEERSKAWATIGGALVAGQRDPAIDDVPALRAAWSRIVEAAERHYEPGRLTTFAAYEYTSAPDRQNLHRNVIFRGRAPEQPFSALDSQNPEELWRWLDGLRAQGIEGIAIPHNMNGSDGRMFQRTTFDGGEIDREWAELRIRNEPIVEMSQVKGTSETHPLLSPNDEWAGFEQFPYRIGSNEPITVYAGGFVRDALLAGLQLEGAVGANPYKFGMIGATDTHNSAGPFEEARYFGKLGLLDNTFRSRGGTTPPNPAEVPSYDPKLPPVPGRWSAAGLAGVWAEDNSREAIFDAMRRKETFATSGPRMKVRFFAGTGFDETILSARDSVRAAYAGGVSMGGDLEAGEAAPAFFAWALRDPEAAWLDRLQIVKGWLENGEHREAVYDVACEGGAVPDPATHRCPQTRGSVDPATCAISSEVGASELRAVWRDPDYRPGTRAFYYVRVLEVPTCRWSTWDAIRNGREPHPALARTIQERAWSSPIWLTPRS